MIIIMAVDQIIKDIYDSGSDKTVILEHLKQITSVDDMKTIIDEFNFDVTYNDNELIIEHNESMDNFDIIELLLDYGANPKAAGDLILQYACDNYAPTNLVKRLLEAGIPASDNALHGAIHTKNIGTITLLLDLGVKVSAKSLRAAAHVGEPEIVRILLDYGADMDAFNTFVDNYDEDDEMKDHPYIETAMILLSHNIPIETIFKYIMHWGQ